MNDSRINTLKKNEDFQKILKIGKKINDSAFMLFYVDNKNSHFNFGIAIGSKLANAVIRNKIKRQVRQIIKNYYYNQSIANIDLVIVIKKDFINKSYLAKKESIFNKINKITNDSRITKTTKG